MDSPRIRQGFLVQFDTLGPDDLWIGGEPAARLNESGRAALVTVRVMAGPWNDAMKAELFDRVDAVLREVAEIPANPAGRDMWMTVLEIPDGGWGLGSRAIRIEQLAPFFVADRQERIRAYLEGPDSRDP